jgi:hypothetical protein
MFAWRAGHWSRRDLWVLHLLQVARCTKIINPGTDEAKYVINVKQIAKVGGPPGRCACRAPSQHLLWPDMVAAHPHTCCDMQFVVGLGDKVAPTDIEEGMRVGCGIMHSFPLYFGVWQCAVSRQCAVSSTSWSAARCHVLLAAGWTAQSTRYRSRCRPRSTPRSR